MATGISEYGEFEEVYKFHKRYPGIYIGSPLNFFLWLSEIKEQGIVYKYSKSLGEYLTPPDFKKLSPSKKSDQAVFITIAPSKFRVPIPYTAENISTLINFGEKISFLYHRYAFVVESGKYSDTPHLHLHILGVIKNPKKHLAQLRAKWDGLCGFVIDWKSDDYDLRQWRKSPSMPSYDDWFQEKLTYMTDEYKGTHQNFEVLMDSPGGAGF